MLEADAIKLFKCLADKSRLQILKSLVQEEMYVERLAERLGLTPATISFHLKKLEEAARENGVSLQVSIDPRYTSTDADDLSIARAGIPTVLLSLPLKYMHTTVETINLDALREGGRVIAHFLSELDAGWEDDLWI